MKSFALVIVSLFASAAFAADVGHITMSQPKTESLTLPNSNVTEAGFHYSSINEGSAFATVGVIHEFENGFAAGVRGYLPVQFGNQAQAYIGEGVARFIILNENDQMWVEGTLGEGFFNGKNDGQTFTLLGADYGYMHHFTANMAAGGNLGLDYGDQRISQNEINSQRTLYSKFTLFGAYYF